MQASVGLALAEALSVRGVRVRAVDPWVHDARWSVPELQVAQADAVVVLHELTGWEAILLAQRQLPLWVLHWGKPLTSSILRTVP